MNTKRNILIAFILNLAFSVFELFGGIFTGSVAILSDSLHDFGDALSIGISFILERKSFKKPDNKYSYGYIKFSVLGGVITTSILIVGSLIVIYQSILRFIHPVEINYSGMIILAVIGVIVNTIAMLITRKGQSINQKSVNLHMLEDSLGWIVVLIGAVIMNFTDIRIIDPVISIIVSLFILYSAIKNLKKALDVFLDKVPDDIDIEKLKEEILKIDGVKNVHHVHIRSVDGINNYASMHIVAKENLKEIKEKIREKLKEYNIVHTVIETEDSLCENENCEIKFLHNTDAHHHHHHH